MTVRIRLSRWFLRLSAFIQTLPVVIMKPDDLVEFSRQTYANPGSVDDWCDDAQVDTGLIPFEIEISEAIQEKTGNLLLLGLGGGREAIPFTTMGYQVTGVDYIPAMVDSAIHKAEKRGVHIEGLVQEISNLDVPESAFDVVWISRAMYSCVPTRDRRVTLMKQIYKSLKPGGTLICLFHGRSNWKSDGKGERLRRIISAAPLGNRAYQQGDILWANAEFLHIFSSEEEIRSELEDGGFFITNINMNPIANYCGAVCIREI